MARIELDYDPVKTHKKLMFDKKWPFFKIITIVDKADLRSMSLVDNINEGMRIHEQISKTLKEHLEKHFVGELCTRPLKERIKSQVHSYLCDQCLDIDRIKFTVNQNGSEIDIRPENLYTLMVFQCGDIHKYNIPEGDGEVETELGTYCFKDGQAYFKPHKPVEYIYFTTELKLDEGEKNG